MIIKTKHFGEINLEEDKVITFDYGLIGFENYKTYTILFDNSEEERPVISWLQSLENENLAFPIINPLLVMEDYSPDITDEGLGNLGGLTEENIALFVTVTVPKLTQKMTVNLKAPIVINSDTKKGCQFVVDNTDYLVKYPVLDKTTAEKGEE